jgi:hypothetical protein
MASQFRALLEQMQECYSVADITVTGVLFWSSSELFPYYPARKNDSAKNKSTLVTTGHFVALNTNDTSGLKGGSSGRAFLSSGCRHPGLRSSWCVRDFRLGVLRDSLFFLKASAVQALTQSSVQETWPLGKVKFRQQSRCSHGRSNGSYRVWAKTRL